MIRPRLSPQWGLFFARKKEMRDMKKLGILGLAAVLVTAFATGCQKEQTSSTTTTTTSEQPAVVKETGTTATSTTGTMGTGTESTMTTTTATTTTTTETKK
jgi:hypothetical protein